MARKQDHPIELSTVERAELEAIVSKGKHKARIIRRAQTLLWSDAGKPDSEIAQLHGITPLTVAKTRQRWVKEKTLEDKPRPGRAKKLDGKQEGVLGGPGLQRCTRGIRALDDAVVGRQVGGVECH